LLMRKVVDKARLQEYSPVVLAYLGDAVFELMVRNHIVAQGSRKINVIHHEAVAMVKAESQAKIIQKILPCLEGEEQDIVRRGRNAKTHIPKNADPGEYHLSTGFEALLGYLYLSGADERLEYLLNEVLKE
jgi:ribonuclease-3 family protein